MKYIVLVSLSQDIGGAQRRYISLFNEIQKRKADYTLVINRSLFDLASQSGLIKNNSKIEILEIDKLRVEKKDRGVIVSKAERGKKRFRALRIIYNWLVEVYLLVKYSIALKKIFSINKPEYVYAIWVGGMIAWPLKFIYRFKLVYSYMDSGYSSIYPGYYNLLKNESIPLSKSNVIDFLSDELKNVINKKVSIPTKTIQSVSPCSFKNYEGLNPVQPKENWIVFASRLEEIKNPLLLLEAINFSKSKCTKIQNYKIWILGEGELYQTLSNYKEKEQLTNVELPGYVPNPEQYLAKSKIFVSIQKNNNYPSQSLLEAMACGNSIIATDVGETRKLINSTNGVLIGESAEELSSVICSLISDDVLMDKLGMNARKKVLEEHNVSNYLSYFYSLETLN